MFYKFRFLLITAVGIGLTVTLNRERILFLLGRLLIFNETPRQSDLVVVLAGDFFGSRVLTGAELGARAYAKRVLISGTPYQDTFECDLAVRFAISKGYSRDLFLVARHHAQSTVEEALALEPVFRRLAATRIILVTSDYHSRRASLVFRLFVPDIEFQSIAAPDRHLQPASWWKTAEGRDLVFAEYSKMFGTVLFKAGTAMGLFSATPAATVRP